MNEILILSYKVTIPLKDLLNKNQLEKYQLGKIITINKQEYMVIDIAKYFYNVISHELSLILVLQNIYATENLKEKDKQVYHFQNQFALNKESNGSIERSIDDLASDINEYFVGRLLKVDKSYLTRVQKISNISFNKETRKLKVDFIHDLIHPVELNTIYTTKKKENQSKFKIHINED